MVEVGDGSTEESEEVIGLVGRAPVFDEPLLEALREVAGRYVQPLARLLRLTTPPRVGRPRADYGASEPRPAPRDAPNPRLVRLGAGDDAAETYAAVIEGLPPDEGAVVAVPEVREGSAVLADLERRFAGVTAVVHSAQDPASRAEAMWSAAQGKSRIVLGGRASMFVHVPRLGAVILHSEHDASFKEQRSPFYDARMLAIARAGASGASAVLASATPSLATWWRASGESWGVEEPERASERSMWPPVELLSSPRTGIPRRAAAAILEARRTSARVLVVLPRARATRHRPGPEQVVEFITRVVPDVRVERADRPGLAGRGLREVLSADVVVATEAALTEVERPKVEVAIAIDADSLLARPTGRAAEEAFQTLWSLAALVSGRNRRGRMLVETDQPDHHVYQALVRGSYRFFAERELEERRRTGSPPFTGLVRLRARGFDEDLLGRLSALPGAEVMGPVPGPRGAEILLKLEALDPALDPLRSIVKESGQNVSVEVDPRDW